VRYRVSWDRWPHNRLPEEVNFQDLLEAARAGRWLYVDDDKRWRIGD
jgi:hypothetical protein